MKNTVAHETFDEPDVANVFPIFGEKRGASPRTLLTYVDIVVFSHLRWDFVFQRPQHLLTRYARNHRVYFIEEPIHADITEPFMKMSRRDGGLCVLHPELPHGLSEVASAGIVKKLVDEVIQLENIKNFVSWYYTPMAMPFTRHLRPAVTVYDCMDELSLFKGAHPQLLDFERELCRRADVMFTGGQSLYEFKRTQHPNIHAFPSSIDVAHFRRARSICIDPPDQAVIKGQRIGFAGVVDERFDIDLIDRAARLRPDWNFIVIGPVVKIDPATLPRHPNVHYLGAKSYKDLPEYIAGWDVAMLPFARNESTRFISPTKTPEYLAAGRPVVSTSIRDVVSPYGVAGLVRIADTATDFMQAAELVLKEARSGNTWINKVDDFLAGNSWDSTWKKMNLLIDKSMSVAAVAIRDDATEEVQAR